MAFDPDQFLAETAPKPAQGGFDPDQFLKDTEPKSIEGFGRNVLEDVKGTASGLGQLAQGLVEHPIDTTGHVVKNVIPGLVEEGKRLGIGELLTGHPVKAVEKFGEAAYQKPLTTALGVLPAVGTVGKVAGTAGRALGISGKAARAGEIAGTAAKAAPLAGEAFGAEMASKITSKALNLNLPSLNRLARKAGTTPEVIALDMGEKVERLLPDFIKVTDSANTKLTKALNAADTSGQGLGNLVKQTSAASKGIAPEANNTINALKKAVAEYDQLDGGEVALQKAATRLEQLQKQGKLDFDRLHKYKSEVGKGFGKAQTPAGTSEVYGILNDGLDDVISRVSTENPNLAGEFARLREIYNLTSNLVPAMTKSAAREVTGVGGGGLMGKAIFGTTGAILGGIPGLIAGTGAKFIQEAIAPDILKNLGYIGMKTARKRFGGPLTQIGQIAPQVPMAGRAALGNISAQQQNELDDYLAAKYGQRGAP